MGPWTKPRPPLPLLASGLTKGGSPPQGLSRIRPAIRMGVMSVIDVKRIEPPGGKVFRRTEVAPCQKATRQDAQPQRDLMAPRPMFGRTMEDLRMRWVTQEGPPLHAVGQGLGSQGEMAPRGHAAADLQAPVRIEVLDAPIRANHGGELPVDVGQMRRTVLTGAGRAQMPQPLAGWHHTGGNQDTPPMTDIFLLPVGGFARLGCLWGICTRENLPTRFLVDADDQASLLEEAPGVHRERADVARLGVEPRSRAMQPIDTAMRLEVGCVTHPPEGRAAQRLGAGMVAEDCGHVIQAPARRWAVVGGRGTRRERQDSDALRGGQSAAAAQAGAHLANRRARAPHTGCARG